MLNQAGFQSNVLNIHRPELQLADDDKCGIIIEINCPQVENVVELVCLFFILSA